MTVYKKRRTTALLSSMGYWRGFLSAFHLYGNFYRSVYTEKDDSEIDRIAMEADWGAVSDDMLKSLDKMKSKYELSK